MVTVAPGSTPPDASVTVPRVLSVPCAAAVAGVPSANTAVNAVHARARIVVLKRLPSCTGFSPQKWMWPNQTFTSEDEYHKRIILVSSRKAHENGHFRVSGREDRGQAHRVFNSLDHLKTLSLANWTYQLPPRLSRHSDFWIFSSSNAVRKWHVWDS